MKKYIFLWAPLLVFGCLEPRISKNAHPEKITALKLFSNPAPPWAMHHIDMPQFTADEQRRITEWLAEGKIETNPKEQNQDFQFISSLDKLLTTGEVEDKIVIKRDLKLESASDLVPTQFEIYWGNVAPKVIDTLNPENKFSACDGSVTAAFENGKYYILDGHHRWTTCLFVRRFLGKPAEFHKLFAPFRYYEERKIYEMLSDPVASKIKEIPDMKVTVLEGNPQGILRIMYELAKLGHGHFSVSAMREPESGPISYLKSTVFLENPLLQWIYFAALVLASLIFSRLLLVILRLKMRKDEDLQKSVAFFDLVLNTLKKYIYSIAFLVSVKFGIKFLAIPPQIFGIVQSALMVAVVWLLTIFAARLFSNSMLRWRERLRSRPDDSEMAHLFPLLIRTGKIVIYFMGFLVMMNRVGYNIYSAVAGLGVGGFALAMAGREAVSHIFAGISLYIDKVIKEGDYLLLDAPIKTWGRVEKVGMRSTTIRTKYNSILVVPNSLLANGYVNNVTSGGNKRMFRGRILLGQKTDFAKVEAAIAEIKKIVESSGYSPEADVHFMKFDAFGFYIRLQYFVEPYTEYHATVSRNNLRILKYLDEQKIELALDFEKLNQKK
ncbi:MAG: mechanosensitive ion channel [Turneriella sp.]|nr:mechanosensitive ion channel [Turneriella sp.]